MGEKSPAGIRPGRQLQKLILLRGNIAHDPLHRAGKDPAKIIDGGGIQGLVLSELVNGGAGDFVPFDQGVGGFLRSLKGFPKGGIVNHGITSGIFYFKVSYLTMVVKETIMSLSTGYAL